MPTTNLLICSHVVSLGSPLQIHSYPVPGPMLRHQVLKLNKSQTLLEYQTRAAIRPILLREADAKVGSPLKHSLASVWRQDHRE